MRITTSPSASSAWRRMTPGGMVSIVGRATRQRTAPYVLSCSASMVRSDPLGGPIGNEIGAVRVIDALAQRAHAGRTCKRRGLRSRMVFRGASDKRDAPAVSPCRSASKGTLMATKAPNQDKRMDARSRIAAAARDIADRDGTPRAMTARRAATSQRAAAPTRKTPKAVTPKRAVAPTRATAKVATRGAATPSRVTSRVASPRAAEVMAIPVVPTATATLQEQAPGWQAQGVGVGVGRTGAEGTSGISKAVAPPTAPPWVPATSLPESSARIALGWAIDVLVGWVVGSVVVGVPFDIIGALAGLGQVPGQIGVPGEIGVVLGTVLGIVFMRHGRARRRAKAYPQWAKGKPIAPGAGANLEEPREAEFGKEKLDPVMPSEVDDLFLRAAAALSEICVNNENLPARSRALGRSCLTSGAAVASALADLAEGDADFSDADAELSTQGFLAAVRVKEDGEAAVRAVYALSWYFAFAFLGERVKTVAREEWLSITQEMLGPSELDMLQIATQDQLIELFESKARPNNDFTFPTKFCEWLNFCLGDEWDDTPPADTVMYVLIGCRAVAGSFLESASKACLLTQ